MRFRSSSSFLLFSFGRSRPELFQHLVIHFLLRQLRHTLEWWFWTTDKQRVFLEGERTCLHLPNPSQEIGNERKPSLKQGQVSFQWSFCWSCGVYNILLYYMWLLPALFGTSVLGMFSASSILEGPFRATRHFSRSFFVSSSSFFALSSWRLQSQREELLPWQPCSMRFKLIFIFSPGTVYGDKGWENKMVLFTELQRLESLKLSHQTLVKEYPP